MEPRRLLAADLIAFNAATGELTVDGTPQNDTLTVAYAGDQVHVQVVTPSGTQEQRFASGQVLSILVRAGAGDDVFSNDTAIPSVAYGDLGADTLRGGEAADRLYGGDGNDRLEGRGGDDVLEGQRDHDILLGGLGADVLRGGAGDDRLEGGAHNDQLEGDEGHDLLFGQGENDQLFGGSGNDEIHGGDGADLVRGGDGADVIWGGAGNDVILADAGDDTIYGEGGDDSLNGHTGSDTIDGGDGHDGISGGDDPDVLRGGLGNDQLFGEGGNDRLFGDEGDDRLFGNDGDDELDGGLGADYLFGQNHNDLLRGGGDVDQLFGEAGDDRLYGDDGNDVLFAGPGNDWLDGGAGVDYAFGDVGDDTLLGGDGDDHLFGEAGRDTLAGGAGHDRLFGGDDDDTLRGDAGDDYLFGENGHDELHGGLGNDQLFGQLGNDVMHGNAGDDRLFGNDGNDIGYGNEGIDFLFGENHDDMLDGGSETDYVYGGPGNDTLWGGDAPDQLYGGDGNDWIDAGAGDDSVLGEAGDDVIQGGPGNDLLYGQDGQDILRGGAGFDFLGGHAGHDVLIGGPDGDTVLADGGRDLVIGGLGADELHGMAGEDIVIGGFTVFDDDDAALREIIALWTQPTTFQQRAAALQDPTFAHPLIPRTHVRDDHVVDQVFGESEADYLFETGYLPGQIDGVDDPRSQTVYTRLRTLDTLRDRQPEDRLQTLVPHAPGSAARRDHAAMLALFDYRDVTHRAVRSGDWSDPLIWRDGQPPADGARVLIPAGVRVRVDGRFSAELRALRADGILAFANAVDTELRVDSMLVGHHGRLEMGTPEQPIAGNVTARLVIADTGPLDRVADPFAFGRGLIVHGSASFQGEQRTAHLPLLNTPLAGETQLRLASVPTNWRVGDTLVLAGTRYGVEDHEVRRIRAIDGNTVTVDPLQFDHDVPQAGLQVHVAHLTRNVVVQSESAEVSRRGHVMFMHTRDVEVHNAAFEDLGRTDKKVVLNDSVVDANGVLQYGTGTNPRARYSLHFHRNGVVNDGNPSVVQGSVVSGSPGWGFVNHSSYVDFLDNVSFNVDGAGFSTEVGDEIGTMRRNLAIYSRGSGETNIIGRFDQQDFGHQGDGFWLQGPGVVVEENIATGQAGHGIVFFTLELIEPDLGPGRFLSSNLVDPSIANGQPTMEVGDVPLRSFRLNVAYDNKEGAKTRYHLRDPEHSQQTVIEDLLLWNNSIGMNIPYTNQTELRNIRIISGLDDLSGTGLDRNDDTASILYNNISIEGYFFGMRVPNQGDSVIQGGRFQNVQNIVVASAAKGDRSLRITGDIQFETIPAELLGVHRQVRIATDPTYMYARHLDTEPFLNSRVTLDFGEFQNARLYFREQRADYVPFPNPLAGLPAEYVGKTNQQLWNSYGIAIGGELAPADAVAVDSIVGLVDRTP